MSDKTGDNPRVWKNFIFMYSMLWKHNKHYLFFSMAKNILEVVSPFIVILMPRYILNELTGQSRMDVIIGFVIVLVVLNFVVRNLQVWFQNLAAAYLKYMYIPMSIEFNRKNMEMDFENLEDPEVLDIKEQAQSILVNSSGLDIYYNSVNGLFVNFFRLLGYGYIIFSIHPIVLLVIIAISVINSLLESKINTKNYNLILQSAPVSRKWAYLKQLGYSVPFGKTIRIYNLVGWIQNKSRANREKYKKQRNKWLFNDALMAVLGVVFGAMQELTTYIFLIYKVVYDNILVGDFTMYLSSMTQVPGSFNSLFSSYNTLRNYSRNVTKYKSFLDRKSKIRSAENPEVSITGKRHIIEYRHVYFRYPRTDIDILKDICIVIEPREKLSVVGENGAGKTTFIKLLLRLYAPTSGEILLDGVNIQEYDYNEYMRTMATVLQDYKIFAFSAFENVALSDSENASEEKISSVLEKAGVQEKIMSLPNGMQSTLSREYDNDGVMLSGGELQKIVLARALYKNSDIVILDEPTSSLSPLAEKDIYEKFDMMIKERTAIFVSHRLSSSLFCDKVALFNNGEITEYGTHRELMELRGEYAEMFRIQASYYSDNEEAANT